MKILPTFYQAHLESQLERSQYLTLIILVNLLQSIKNVSIEALANAFPLLIQFDSRRRKIQRFLSNSHLKIETLWWPILSAWLETELTANSVIYLAIDRTSWGCINLLMISFIWNKRAIPVYFQLFPKLGSSNFEEQKAALVKVLPIFNQQKTQKCWETPEFCSVLLGNWLREQKVYFCLRLKKDEFIAREDGIWQELNDLGLKSGVSFFLKGVKVTEPLPKNKAEACISRSVGFIE